MPHLRVELHDRRPKRVFAGYPDIDVICAALVWCTRRAFEGALEVEQVRTIADSIRRDVGEGVGADVGNLFSYATSAVGCHGRIDMLAGEGWLRCRYIRFVGVERCKRCNMMLMGGN